MAGLLLNQGEQIMAEAFINKTAPQDLILKLYKNNYIPIDASIESDFTEADFTGYAHIDVPGATAWTATPGAPTTLIHTVCVFTSSADSQNQPIYGWFLVQLTSGKAVAALKFSDGPYTIVNNGDIINVTPEIDFKKTGE
jgi:hypothetical protein